jgi:UDPglucose 6-dehydrogenase/GDP-mannose 6-dehydrogenase
MDVNIYGTRHMLELAKEKKVISFLYLSTSEVYGDPPENFVPTSEDYWGNVSCTGPRACYDESKRVAETLCFNFFHLYNLPIKITRTFNAYGPKLGLNDGRVIPDFIKNIINNGPITLLSEGHDKRSFCYVSDNITGQFKVLLSNKNGEVFNIGNTQEVSMIELANKLIEISGRKSEIIKKKSTDKDYNTDSPKRRCPNITKANNMLGFCPKVSIEEGLSRTLRWHLNERKPINISVLGAGYVGLLTALSFADKGHNVTIIEKDSDRVRKINNGECPFYEPGLSEMLKRNIGKRLFASEDLNSILLTDITFVAVGTPQIDSGIDLSQIREASVNIGKILSKKSEMHHIIVKSTVLPGTTEETIIPIILEKSGKSENDIGFGMNPEFLAEGTAVEDVINPGRIVIGSTNANTIKILKKIYKDFNAPIVLTNIRTAEMIKYASNSLLATLISFSNEIADISELKKGIDAKEVLEAVHLDKRLTPDIDNQRIRPGILSFLMAGCGFGGSCFPKDLQALKQYATDNEYEPKIISKTIEINKSRYLKIIQILKSELKELSGKRITILGLSFKPNTDDIRESPAIPLIKRLIKENAHIIAYDPKAIQNMKRYFKDIEYASNLKNAISGSDAAVLVTSWKEFVDASPDFFLENMRNPLLIDGRRALNRFLFEKKLNYRAIGLT